MENNQEENNKGSNWDSTLSRIQILERLLLGISQYRSLANYDSAINLMDSVRVRIWDEISADEQKKMLGIIEKVSKANRQYNNSLYGHKSHYSNPKGNLDNALSKWEEYTHRVIRINKIIPERKEKIKSSGREFGF